MAPPEFGAVIRPVFFCGGPAFAATGFDRPTYRAAPAETARPLPRCQSTVCASPSDKRCVGA